MRRVLIAMIGLGLLISACTFPRPTVSEDGLEPEPTVDTALVERGKDLYLENYCGVCHTLSLAETRGVFGPNHDDAGLRAIELMASDGYEGNAVTAEDYLRESLLEPQAYMVPEFAASAHAMPPFTHLPEEDIDAIVYMLLQQQIEPTSD